MSGDRGTAPLLVGAARLLADAVVGGSEVVETMHARISPLQRNPADPALGRTRGVTGFVHAAIRAGARLGGRLMDRIRRDRSAHPYGTRGAGWIGALNGVVGDHLDRTENPLAVAMRLRVGEQVLDPARARLDLPGATGRVAVLVHGLCMGDRQWLRNGHDHGRALAADLGCTPVYLNYNTGRPIARNADALADLLEWLVRAWPVPVEDLTLIGHSMGGLVIRGACLRAEQSGHAWPGQLGSVVCLGTPLQGSPVERGGHLLERMLAMSGYTAPFGRLASVRSAGITDLRHGEAHGPSPAMPGHARMLTIAASMGRRPGDLLDRVVGDGLVPSPSAHGRASPGERRSEWTAFGVSHFGLLSDPAVYLRLRDWIAG